MTTPRDETALAMRFSIDHKGLPYRDPKGVWVAYSHHESALTAQAQEIVELRELLRVAKCPQCDGSGVVLDERTICVPGCCEQPLRTGECCGNAVPTPELIQEPAPCQWCDERNRAIEGAKP